ncbi:MAG: UPF0058 family protein [Archaeoglobales archaeon]|nr:UPF0058 family protein [Archaeoglobales archaeon]
MQKEEVVLLHLTLSNIKNILENAGYYSPFFKYYEELGVEPGNIHRSKLDHKKAIFLLCKGIFDIINSKQPKELLENEKIKSLIFAIQ